MIDQDRVDRALLVAHVVAHLDLHLDDLALDFTDDQEDEAHWLALMRLDREPIGEL